MWDLPDNPESIALVEAFARDGKPLAAVCHGPVALTNVRRPDGAYLVAGKNVTGFANSEEEAVGLTNVVPFLLENRLRERGGHYHKAADFAPYVLVDGTLVTGQNPASSVPAADELIGLLRAASA
jgi:putative intracellular protease/amidase